MQPPYPEKPKCKKCKTPIFHTNKNGMCAKCAKKAGVKMAHGLTSEERAKKFKLCGAKRRSDGKPCRLFAGQNTDHPGVGRCRIHGGNTPSGKKSVIVAQAKAEMVKLGVPIQDVDGPRALMALLRMCAGHVAWLQGEIAGLDDLSDPEGRVLVEMYDAERDRLTRVAQACVSSGIAERFVRIEEKKLLVLGTALRRAAERAGFDEAEMKRLGSALRTELASVDVEANGNGGMFGQAEVYDAESFEETH